MKKTISVDLDSTIFDLLTLWIEFSNIKFNTNYIIEDVLTYNQDFLMNSMEFIDTNLYDDAVPIPNAVLFIDTLKQHYNVQIVTHTFEGHRESKLNFIKKYFGDIKVICTDSCKLESTKDTILIDDKLEHITKHIDINKGIGIVYTMDDRLQYNKTDRKDVVRLGSYSDIVEYLNKINKEA